MTVTLIAVDRIGLERLEGMGVDRVNMGVGSVPEAEALKGAGTARGGHREVQQGVGGRPPAACLLAHAGAAYAGTMTQPSQRVLYLPPGVLPPPAVPQAPQMIGGPPFDRVFFESVLAQAIQAFCQQTVCEMPFVELLTVDGGRHYVKAIMGVSDQWVALQTSVADHEHPVQVFVPYATIFRVEVHPAADDNRRHLGFLVPTDDPRTTLTPMAFPSSAAANGAPNETAKPVLET